MNEIKEIKDISPTEEVNHVKDVNDMDNIRVFYHKKGRAKYISHLDITRCMQRALKRSALPIWYTQGFNPHIYLTFALPLSLGYESESESMDLRLERDVPIDEVAKRLNEVLPPDIVVKKVALQQNKTNTIKKAVYDVTVSSDDMSGKLLGDCLQNFLNQDTIDVVKRTKKGSKTIDIKPDIKVNNIEVFENSVKIDLVTSAGNEKNINPTLITDEMIGKYSLENVQVCVLRKRILMENGEDFC